MTRYSHLSLLVIFSDAVGGRKKGRIPGLGSLAFTIGDASSVLQPGLSESAVSSRSESSQATDISVVNLEAELAPLRAEVADAHLIYLN